MLPLRLFHLSAWYMIRPVWPRSMPLPAAGPQVKRFIVGLCGPGLRPCLPQLLEVLRPTVSLRLGCMRTGLLQLLLDALLVKFVGVDRDILHWGKEIAIDLQDTWHGVIAEVLRLDVHANDSSCKL